MIEKADTRCDYQTTPPAWNRTVIVITTLLRTFTSFTSIRESPPSCVD
ncbi:MAG: hypothetical protein ACE5OP_12350 [Candidatus Glassbacteria bacterium]